MALNITQVLKGTTGDFEINRVVGALGATAYILGANAFVWWDVVHLGHAFDVTAYCLSFPTGLGVAVGSIAGAVALKDRNVATARLTNAKADGVDNANAQEQPK
jgi:uncharacterized iron-regulated membrane protein